MLIRAAQVLEDALQEIDFRQGVEQLLPRHHAHGREGAPVEDAHPRARVSPIARGGQLHDAEAVHFYHLARLLLGGPRQLLQVGGELLQVQPHRVEGVERLGVFSLARLEPLEVEADLLGQRAQVGVVVEPLDGLARLEHLLAQAGDGERQERLEREALERGLMRDEGIGLDSEAPLAGVELEQAQQGLGAADDGVGEHLPHLLLQVALEGPRAQLRIEGLLHDAPLHRVVGGDEDVARGQPLAREQPREFLLHHLLAHLAR